MRVQNVAKHARQNQAKKRGRRMDTEKNVEEVKEARGFMLK